jgi:outer membrane lipase/esterase
MHLDLSRSGVEQMTGSRLVALFLALCVLPGSALARPFNQLWVFGDSTVDTGFYRKAPYSGEPNYDFYIKQSAAAVGRPTSSPGPMSVEVLATAIGVTAKPANQPGTDYATGGARDAQTNTATSSGFPNAVPTRTQLTEYMRLHKLTLGLELQTNRNLYVISSGGNDVAFAIKNFTSTTDATNYITNAADTLAATIKQLSGPPFGFAIRRVHIIVVGLPESFGTAEQQQYRQLHDATLQARLHALHVPYVWADLDGVRKLIESFENGQSPFNISHYTTANPACPKPVPNSNPTVTTDWAYVCSPSNLAATQPANAAASEFADDAHWATGAQAVLGSYLYCLAQKTWPGQGWPASNANLPFACSNFPML